MGVCRQLTIGVRGEALASAVNPLFSALTCVFPVEFRPWTNGDCHGLDALILSGQNPEEIRGAAKAGLPVFAAPAPPHSPASARSAEFRLSESSVLCACLRGHRFEEQEWESASAMPMAADDIVLASQDGKPIWLQRRIEGTDVTLVTSPLPWFTAEDHIYENFQANGFLRLLPLLQFIRNLTSEADWQSPPTPACLLVDDPSLHTRTYGHLDFHRLAVDAREQGFYVSVATVPLDSWWINRQTRELFRENAPRVSVLLHGNDHTYQELARSLPDAENLSLLAQALRRSRRLEQRYGMHVCRVMECPHGSVSVAMLEPMARLGYEAVFASTAHLLRFNPGAAFRSSLGAEHTLLEKKAVPVIPRIRAQAGWQTEVRLAAFLGQPLILAAHHWDFADQRHLAADFVRIVNSLPNVRWGTPTDVARACYQFRQKGDILHLKPGSRRVDVRIPHATRWLMIHRPWLRGTLESELLVVRTQENELFCAASSADVVGPIPVQGGAALQISSSVLNRVDCDSVLPPRLRYWPLVRKLMVEIRDRSRVPFHMWRPVRLNDTPAGKRQVAEGVNRGSAC